MFYQGAQFLSDNDKVPFRAALEKLSAMNSYNLSIRQRFSFSIKVVVASISRLFENANEIKPCDI
jgi:hypothetical protein